MELSMQQTHAIFMEKAVNQEIRKDNSKKVKKPKRIYWCVLFCKNPKQIHKRIFKYIGKANDYKDGLSNHFPKVEVKMQEGLKRSEKQLLR